MHEWQEKREWKLNVDPFFFTFNAETVQTERKRDCIERIKKDIKMCVKFYSYYPAHAHTRLLVASLL